VVPNKGHVHAIRAFAHYYHHLRGRGARLFLVGKQDERLKRYTDELSHEVARHHLDGAVEFPGSVSPRQLKTYFGHAAVFLCTSLHEGFCVPLAEAMCYQVPIVAYNGGAVGWTLGKAGLVWDRLDPALFGESIRRVVEDSRVRDALIRSQRRRYFQHFTPEAIERCFEMTMAPLLRGVRVRRAV
jgi:glycosyltransferase involved in cell wall biosynthesis